MLMKRMCHVMIYITSLRFADYDIATTVFNVNMVFKLGQSHQIHFCMTTIMTNVKRYAPSNGIIISNRNIHTHTKHFSCICETYIVLC